MLAPSPSSCVPLELGLFSQKSAAQKNANAFGWADYCVHDCGTESLDCILTTCLTLACLPFYAHHTSQLR